MGQQHDFYLVPTGNPVSRSALDRGFLACFQQPSALRSANLDSSGLRDVLTRIFNLIRTSRPSSGPERLYPAFPCWPWHGYSIHPRGPNTASFRADPRTSLLSVGARARPSAHKTLIERAERRSGRHYSLRNVFEPKAIDPRPRDVTRSAAAAPRSSAASRRTASGSDALPLRVTSNSARASRADRHSSADRSAGFLAFLLCSRRSGIFNG